MVLKGALRGVLALDTDSQPAGYAYGTTALPDQWWPSRIAAAIGPERAERELYGSFAVTELVVAQPHRRCGLGLCLMQALLADLPHPGATLSTERTNVAARMLYERLGFDYLVGSLRFIMDGDEFVVMGRSLPLQ